MKKIGIMLLLVFAMFFLTLAASRKIVSKDTLIENSRHFYHDENKCDSKDDKFCTHLPLVIIDTNNEEIPGEERDGTRVTSTIKIVDNKKGGNHLDDKADFTSLAEIRYRGNSSMLFDKKGYSIKLVHKDKSENHVRVLGMGRHDEWALHGPYIDKTLMRNYLWYHVMKDMSGYAPDARFCELYVNGEYKGVYVFTETATRGDQSRIPISKYDKNDSVTSYIVRLDKGSNNEFENINSFSKYAKKTGMQLDVIYPGAKNLTPELNRFITEDLSRFEKALYSYDYDSKKHGYPKYINVDSFVDYYIINEFTQNYDAGSMSTYLYKDLKDKYGLFIWDFNSANNNYDRDISIEDFEFQWVTWYVMLMKDEKFNQRIIDRYHYLRTNYLNEEYLNTYIDNIISYLGDAIDRNYEVWGYTFLPEKDFLKPRERNVRSYEEAILQLKQHIRDRGRFLDEKIETIKQFSAESKVKKFNH